MSIRSVDHSVQMTKRTFLQIFILLDVELLCLRGHFWSELVGVSHWYLY